MKLIYHTCYFSFYRVDDVTCRVPPAPPTYSKIKEALAVKCTVSSQKHRHINSEGQVGPQLRRHSD